MDFSAKSYKFKCFDNNNNIDDKMKYFQFLLEYHEMGS